MPVQDTCPDCGEKPIYEALRGDGWYLICPNWHSWLNGNREVRVGVEIGAKKMAALGADRRRRREEADQLLKGKLYPRADREEEFIANCRLGRPITPKMLFWLRDIANREE